MNINLEYIDSMFLLRQEHQESSVQASELCRRSDQVATLQERNTMLTHLLSRGDTDYQHRVSDIQTLTREVHSLRCHYTMIMIIFTEFRQMKAEFTVYTMAGFLFIKKIHYKSW